MKKKWAYVTRAWGGMKEFVAFFFLNMCFKRDYSFGNSTVKNASSTSKIV